MYYLIAVPPGIHNPAEAKKTVDLALGQTHISLDEYVKPNSPPLSLRETLIRLKGNRKHVGFVLSDPRFIRSACDVQMSLMTEFHHVASVEDHRVLDQGYQLTILKSRNQRLRIGDQFTINDYRPRPGLFEIGREEE